MLGATEGLALGPDDGLGLTLGRDDGITLG